MMVSSGLLERDGRTEVAALLVGSVNRGVVSRDRSHRAGTMANRNPAQGTAVQHGPESPGTAPLPELCLPGKHLPRGERS